MRISVPFVLLISLALMIACQKKAPVISPELTVSLSTISFPAAGGEKTFTLTANGAWEIKSAESWVTLNPSSGASGTVTIAVKAGANGSNTDRNTTLTVASGSLTKQITVSQSGNVFPAGMTDNAVDLAKKMKVGWNLGNSLEALNIVDGVIQASETAWGNPKTTKALIDAVKKAGFNAIRIPCGWSGYLENETTYKIKPSWMARVKEVVDYCMANDMYAILNIHWDGGWLENNPTYAAQAQVNKKQKALWEQIATAFKDYDQKLLFAGTNEVRANYNTPTSEHITVQQSYNQTFVDAVRSTGGKNTWRNLIVQSYNTNIQFANDFMTMPTDPTPNRLMAEVHFYDPWDFAGDDNSTKYLWGAGFAGNANTSTWGQEAWVNSTFALMKTKFVSKNIPVILGEYGAILRSSLSGTALANHKTSRNNYLTYVTRKAIENGIVPFYWDNGHTGDAGFGLFNRSTHAIVHTDALQAIMNGAK